MGGGSSTCAELLGLSAPAEAFEVEGKRYTVVRQLGEGGYAFVYLVRDDAGKEFALKKARVNAKAERAVASLTRARAMRVR